MKDYDPTMSYIEYVTTKQMEDKIKQLQKQNAELRQQVDLFIEEMNNSDTERGKLLMQQEQLRLGRNEGVDYFVETPNKQVIRIYLHATDEGIICDILDHPDGELIDSSYWYWDELEKEDEQMESE